MSLKFIALLGLIFVNHGKALEIVDMLPQAECPLPYDPVGDTCYLLLSEPYFTYQAGEVLCSSLNGHLVYLESRAEAEVMTRYLERTHPDCDLVGNDVWIGGLGTADGGFFWDDMPNQPVRYTNWLPGQPDERFKSGIALACSAAAEYRWYDIQMERELAVLCETTPMDEPNTSTVPTVTTSTTTSEPTIPAVECPQNYTLIGERCYNVVDFERLEWLQADAACIEDDGWLAMLETRDEIDALTDYMNDNYFDCAGFEGEVIPPWIGGIEDSTTGIFYWGKELVNKVVEFNWAEGMPNAIGFMGLAMDCRNEERYKWFNAFYTERLYYICETDPL